MGGQAGRGWTPSGRLFPRATQGAESAPCGSAEVVPVPAACPPRKPLTLGARFGIFTLLGAWARRRGASRWS